MQRIRPCVGSGSSERPLADWQQALPPKLSWPSSTSKTEDGGGVPSTALHMVRLSQDKLVALRSRWFKLVSDTKHCFKITAALTSGCKEPPLSDTDLQPYIEDLLHILGCPPGDHLLHRMPGQPFRLHLRHKLAAFLGDPVAKFLTELPFGVPLGVNEPLTPSPAWPVHTGVISRPEPSVECLVDAWKSAQDHLDIVENLIQEEIEAGFIAHVPGSIPELQSQFSRTAIGKLGVVIAPGRSPRLVVDRSISNVTANTVLHNHMMLPRISDVHQCAPGGMAQQQRIQLTLDV